MKLTNLLFAASILAGMTLTGCNQAHKDGSDPDYPGGGSGPKVYIDFVTLESTGPSGTSFTLQSKNDAPLITYFTTQQMPASEFYLKDRVVISYTPTSGERYQNGPISVYEALKPYGAGAVPYPKTSIQTQDWKSDPIEMYELHRSGNYINVIFNADANYENVTAELVLDAATAELDMPEYYLLFNRKNQETSTQKYAFYMSYSIKDQWAREDLRGIRIKYTDSKGTTHKDILKTNPVTPKPAN